jgi:predicted phage tail protein
MSACRCWFCLRLLVISLVLLGFWGNIFIQDSLANSNPPSTPAGLSATPGPGQVTLAWNPNPEPDIKFYKIYISLSANGPFSWNSSAIHPTTTFTKTELFAGVTYYFKLSAVNTAGLESNPTDPVSATPTAPPGTPPSTPGD